MGGNYDGRMMSGDLSKNPHSIEEMFNRVASRYDVCNTILSLGNDRLWRVATAQAVHPQSGERILDIAAGTGTSSAVLAESGACVVAADFSEKMVEVGRLRFSDRPNIQFVRADATALPFDDGEFDTVTISFGLRNVVDPHKALAEFFRVTKKGGRLVVCEFSTPPSSLMRTAYRFYSRAMMPLIAMCVSSDPGAYTYLNESIRAWPPQNVLASWIRQGGFARVEHRNLSGGIVALHRGIKP